ncbi:MAG: hypothetical protein MJE66_13375, partial [Proteobacteria bacterium]|nr:hypothetical protein [Pseudomonadota bacterium]
LLTAEKVLLEQTLHGSVQMLTDVLAMADPAAFGRATRLKQLAGDLSDALGLDGRWQHEGAAMFSQLGSVILPTATVTKLHNGEALSDAEKRQVDELPAVTEQLVANIPRLDDVRRDLVYQDKHFDGSGKPADDVKEEDIPAGARILRLVLDYDTLEEGGDGSDEIFDKLRGRSGVYDPAYVEALADLQMQNDASDGEVRTVRVDDLRVSMTFVGDCVSNSGRLLVARGQEITPSVLARIRNFHDNEGIQEPLRVRAAKLEADPDVEEAIG